MTGVGGPKHLGGSATKVRQMTHLMTSNETILNTKLLEIIKIYI